MIICDTNEFVFVHIPKCAGTTIRNALAPYDEHADRFWGRAVAPHSVLGSLDYPHIPLAVLQTHFPEDFARLVAYQSFALVRDPFARFPSSLHERLIHRDGQTLSLRSAAEIAREVDAVLACLANHPSDAPITDPGLIHFSRQCDYIFLDGHQIVDRLRTVADVDTLLEEVSDIVGVLVRPKENMNARLDYASPMVQRLQLAVTALIERVLPRRIWKPAYVPIKRALHSLGLIHPSRNPLEQLPNFGDIEAFVAEFYSHDIHLFERLEAERRAQEIEVKTI